MKKKCFIHESSYIDENVKIGTGTRIWHFCHIQGGATIGNNCVLGQNVYVGSNVVIGNNVKIQNNVSIYEGVELEDFVFCGPSVVFTNVLFPRSEFPQKGTEFFLKTIVKKGSTLGANSSIICGNIVGRYAFIGAGAVVSKDVPDFALVIGNPACLHGWLCVCSAKLHFSTSSAAIESAACKICGRIYRKEGMVVRQETK